MCGLVGYIGSPEPSAFSLAVSSIQHRGPDETSTFKSGTMCFGFARLAILEIQDGQQPFHIPEENLVMIFNGEIYNYRSLRSEMEKEGITFQGKSEVEVLGRGYRLWKERLFSKIRGMFAVAIYDFDERSVILARDPLGKKPLYWYQEQSQFAFASEIKALWHLLPKDDHSLNETALACYFISDSVPTPLSIDQRISKLQPGTLLKWRNNTVTAQKFWPSPHSFERTSSEQVDIEFFRIVTDSIQRRLISDVPVGIFLSSGVDSSAVASVVSRQSEQKIHSFTLKFDGSYDESKAAEEYARKFNFEHQVINASDENLAEIWRVARKTLDEPLNDPAILPMMLLSREASKSVKVAITGDGGDELFLGYPHFKLHQMPLVDSSLISPPIKAFLNRWPDNQKYFGLGFLMQRFARGLGIQDLCERDLAWRGSFPWNNIANLLSQETYRRVNLLELNECLTVDYRSSLLKDSRDSKLSWWYLRSYLMDTVLVKVDRASMAFGLECRSPLLDIDVVEYVLTKREQNELKHLPGKALLKRLVVMSGFGPLPKTKKHGMGVPVVRMLKTVLNEEFERLTNQDLIESQGIFNLNGIRRIKQEFYEGRRDIRKEVWSIFTFQAWLQQYNLPCTRVD